MALLQFIDGCIEYTKDIFTVPAANSTAAATCSKVVTTATEVTVEVANQAAGLVGIQPSDIVFSDKFLKGNYKDQVTKRGWTLEKIANTLNDPYKTTSQHINKYTGNTVTYYYIDDFHYVARDDTTKKIIQISDLTKDRWK